MKVFIINGNYQYQSMFVKAGWDITDDFFKANLIQFTGGEDVTPEIYGKTNTNSYNNFNRDLIEAGYFALAIRCNKPMAGICRGGQFLNVMCGGKMIQDISGHAIRGTHTINIFSDGMNIIDMIEVTSTHHQEIVPSVEARLIGEADDGVAEVIFYENNNCLCFQPHPEFPG